MKYEYRSFNEIHSGTISTVYYAEQFEKKTNMKITDVIIKKYINDDNNYIISTLLRETSCLNKINKHKFKHIINVIEIYTDKTEIYIVFEAGGSDLLNSSISNSSIDNIILNIIESMNFINSIGYIHGDLNFKNIVIKDDMAKIIDFGLSTKNHRKHMINMPAPYVCPHELKENKFEKNFMITNVAALDVWMLGCIIYFILIGDSVIDPNTLTIKYKEDEYLKMIKRTKHAIITKMLSLNANTRIGIKKVNEYYNLTSDYEPFMFEYKYKKTNKHNFDIEPFINHIHNYYNEKVDIETIVLTIKNLSILYDTNITKNILHDLIICFWLSEKISRRTNNDNIESLMKLFEHFKINITQTKLQKRVTNICEKLNWDIDPKTAYDYIIFVPEKYKKEYVNMLYDITIEYKHSYINEFIKFATIMTILKLVNTDIKKMINKSIEIGVITESEFILNMIDIKLYLQKCLNCVAV